MNGNNNYQELINPENDNQESESFFTDFQENTFNWTNIIMEISISITIAFCIFYLISEVHEVSNTNSSKTETWDFIENCNNSIETVYLLIVSFGIGLHIMMYRWSRNLWYSVPFDNYSMIIMLCVYGVVEFIYYLLKFISISILMLSKTSAALRILNTFSEFLFMVTILPFVMISIENNVRKNNKWLKLRTKITLILSMVGCLLIFTRKSALKFKEDYRTNNNTPDMLKDQNITKIYEIIKTAIDLLELFDINYFIIAFIFLLNPLFYLKKNEDTSININVSLESISRNRFSMMNWISLVRFRLWTIFISIGIISILGTALYISSSLLSYDKITGQLPLQIFHILVSIAYLITIIYGIVYYYFYIETWDMNKNQNLNSDQYFNFITSSAQLVYSSTMLINLITSSNCLDNIIPIINYFLLAIQIMIQANCINSASKRSIRKFSTDEFDTWKFKLVPPVVLSSLNFITMIISLVYSVNSPYSSIIPTNEMGFIIKDLTLPLTILNRFHGMSFFINLTVKQWK